MTDQSKATMGLDAASAAATCHAHPQDHTAAHAAQDNIQSSAAIVGQRLPGAGKMNHIQQFRQAIEAAGIPAPTQILDDGKLHRFGTNDKRGDTAGWYVLYGDAIPAGAFGCWRSGLVSVWCATSDQELNDTERQTMRERLNAIRRQREQEQMRIQAQAKETAVARLADSEPATDHPYLSTKGIKPHGVRASAGNLLIPLRDTQGTVHSLQTITPDGGKRFLTGGRVTGCYFAIGKPDGVLVVCEGLATGASIHECTGHAVAVAFSANNLEPVAVALREKYPSTVIIIAADNDHATPGNPGLTMAHAAARAAGGYVAVPNFEEVA